VQGGRVSNQNGTFSSESKHIWLIMGNVSTSADVEKKRKEEIQF
jgi:hypothetical protein